MAARYHFLSEFSLTSERDAVWAALTAIRDWPTWWQSLKRVDLERDATSDDGVGGIYRLHVRAPTGYGFEYSTETVEVDRPRRIDGISSGDIVGRRLPRLPRPLRRYRRVVPLARRNAEVVDEPARPPREARVHVEPRDKVMTDFGRGLAQASGGTLTSVRNRALKPGSPGFYEMPAVTG